MKKFLISLIVSGLMILTLSNPALAKKSKGHDKTKVKYSDLDRANKAGEIRGSFKRCAGNSSGVFVYIVGRSFNALLAPEGQFTLSYVPPGTYSLAFVHNNHVLTTVDDVQVRKHKLTDLGEIGFCPDNDNDGFDESVDCNDNNPNINPDASETCDGEDNNCDGEVDEGCPECTDGDNDGFFAQNGCGTAVDCNDHDSTINPNSLEVCDGIDNNCDGQTDEGCPLNCPTGTADCNGDRVDCETDISSDPANCGACGSACAQGQTCVNGACEGGAACSDQEIQNLQSCLIGCDSALDPLTCQTTCLGQVSGSCAGTVQLLGLCSVNSGCPVNQSSDLLSLCVFQNCLTQWQDAFGDFEPGCPAGQTECNGQCVDLASDEANCGQCGSACSFNETCNNGSCSVQCSPGQVNCGGNCVNNQSDPNNCGGCNVACPSSAPVCNNGVCEADNCGGAPLTRSCGGGPNPGVGICQSGTQSRTCTNGQLGNWGFCIGSVDPQPETCDGQDNDCDGQIDEATDGGSCNTGLPGICSQGANVCSNGQITCQQTTQAQAEVCGDNLDNDCDGVVDNGCTNPVDCQMSEWTAWSACSATCGGGIQTRTRTVTVPPANGGAACGLTEEQRTCNTQACQVDADKDGYFSIATGGSDCNDSDASINPNATEVCDNIDNNCDGQTDEGGVCQTQGACQSNADCGAGFQCRSGQCFRCLLPSHCQN